MPAPSSASTSTQTPMSYDRFKPKFPLDPFGEVVQTPNAPPARVQWTLDVNTLPPPSILQLERRVILVIGQPPAAALTPLFASPQLASSLLIIASHRPPPLPFDTHPAVHTLRLRTPLAVADAGATRLVEVLEWALQVAQIWRRTGGPKKQELMEEVSPGSESVPLAQSFGRLRYSVAPDTQHEQAPTSAFSPDASTTSLASSSNTKKTFRRSLFRRQSTLPPQSDSTCTRPFDALLHFLPADVPDKMRLKAAILVTTLTRPYLATPPARTPSTRFYSESNAKPSKKSTKRWSFLRGATGLASPGSFSSTHSSSFHSMSTSDLSEVPASRRGSLSTVALLRARRSRLVHLVPSPPAKASSSRFPAPRSKYMRSQAHLIRSIEAFLLSFCFSAPVDLPSPIAGFASSDSDNAKARPYVLPIAALTEVLRIENESEEAEEIEWKEDVGNEDEEKRRWDEWTLAELVLCGALEGEEELVRAVRNAGRSEGVQRVSNDSEKGKDKQLENANVEGRENGWMAHRAWIGSVRDIIFVHGSLSKTKNVHIVPSRSSSSPQLRSQAQSHPQPKLQSHSEYEPQLRAKPHLSESHAARRQQVHVQAFAAQNQDPTTNPNPNSSVHTNSKRRGHQPPAIKSVAIEKRLPTPPEDVDEELNEKEDGGTVCPSTSDVPTPGQSPHAESLQAPQTNERRPEGRHVPYSRSHPPLRRETAHMDLRNDRPRQILSRQSESSCIPRQQELRPFSQTRFSSSPSMPYPITQPSSDLTRTSPSVLTHSSASRRHSERRQYEPATPSSRRLERYEAANEHERASRTLPTPPDSEEASLEGTSDAVPPPLPSHEREYAAGTGAPASREHGHERDGKRRNRIGEGDVDVSYYRFDEGDREREHSRRTRSYPLRPSQAPASAERMSPQRAKTTPKERPRESAMEYQVSDVRAKVDRPIKPKTKRNSSSEERRVMRVPVPSKEQFLPSRPPPSPRPTQTQPSQPTYSLQRHSTKKPVKWKFWNAGNGAVVRV